MEPQIFDKDLEGDILNHLSDIRYEDNDALLNQDLSKTVDPGELIMT